MRMSSLSSSGPPPPPLVQQTASNIDSLIPYFAWSLLEYGDSDSTLQFHISAGASSEEQPPLRVRKGQLIVVEKENKRKWIYAKVGGIGDAGWLPPTHARRIKCQLDGPASPPHQSPPASPKMSSSFQSTSSPVSMSSNPTSSTVRPVVVVKTSSAPPPLPAGQPPAGGLGHLLVGPTVGPSLSAAANAASNMASAAAAAVQAKKNPLNANSSNVVHIHARPPGYINNSASINVPSSSPTTPASSLSPSNSFSNTSSNSLNKSGVPPPLLTRTIPNNSVSRFGQTPTQQQSHKPPNPSTHDDDFPTALPPPPPIPSSSANNSTPMAKSPHGNITAANVSRMNSNNPPPPTSKPPPPPIPIPIPIPSPHTSVPSNSSSSSNSVSSNAPSPASSRSGSLSANQRSVNAHANNSAVLTVHAEEDLDSLIEKRDGEAADLVKHGREHLRHLASGGQSALHAADEQLTALKLVLDDLSQLAASIPASQLDRKKTLQKKVKDYKQTLFEMKNEIMWKKIEKK